jgi:hypothetical protein
MEDTLHPQILVCNLCTAIDQGAMITKEKRVISQDMPSKYESIEDSLTGHNCELLDCPARPNPNHAAISFTSIFSPGQAPRLACLPHSPLLLPKSPSHAAAEILLKFPPPRSPPPPLRANPTPAAPPPAGTARPPARRAVAVRGA